VRLASPLLYAFLLWSATASVRAEESSVAHIASPTIEPLIRMALALAAIGAAAWALGVWARRRRISRTGTDFRIDVLALRNLGPRQRLALIEVADRRLLIGLSNDAIRPIADLSETLQFERELERQLPGEESDEPAPVLSGIGRFEGLDG